MPFSWLWRTFTLGLTALIIALLTACAEADGPRYLQQDIPPCTPVENSTREPCGPTIPLVDAGSTSRFLPDTPTGLREFLGERLEYMRHGVVVPVPSEPYVNRFAGYIVVRATYLPGTVRCKGNKDLRTVGETTEQVYHAGSIPHIQCFADIRVNSYILGTGPPIMTVMALSSLVGARDKTPAQQEAIESAWEQRLEHGDERVAGIVGREAVLFIGPAFDYTVEVWQVFGTWGVSQHDDGAVMILHPDGWAWPEPQYRSQIEMTLADFTAAVQAAHATRTANLGGRAGTAPTAPMVVLDANKLHQHHVDTGNTAHPSGPPEPPPPVREK